MKEGIATYSRISQDLEREGLGVARQQSDTHKLALQKGWSASADYIDNNVSAYRTVTRPQFERLLADLTAGKHDGLIVYDLDRLARQPRDLERLIDIYEARPSLLFATVQGDFDLSTTDGRFVARLMVNVANKASADTSRRIKRKILEHAESGRPHGSPKPPYGYRLDTMFLDPVEAAVMRQMGTWFTSGYSYREIAKRLNESGRLTRAGQPWLASTIKKLLANHRYAGIRFVDGRRYKGKWEVVFDAEEWSDIERMRVRRRENRRGRPNNARYLLTRLVVCGRCGADMGGMTKRDSAKASPLRRTYQCRTPGCGMCVGAEPLEHFIREAVIFRLDGPVMAEALQAHKGDSGIGELYGELDRLERRKDELFDEYTDGGLERAEWLQAKRRLQNQITEVQVQIDRRRQKELRVRIEPGQTLRDAWSAHESGWRRELIDVVIASIRIAPAVKRPMYATDDATFVFDPARVTVKWKV